MSGPEVPPPRFGRWTGSFVRALLAALLVWSAYWLAITVLQWHVAALPSSTPATVGLLYFIQLSPMLLITPFVGPLLDRVGGRPVLLAASVFMVTVAVAGFVFAESGVLLFMMSAVISACLGLCMAVGSPAVHAFVPTTVPAAALGGAVRQVAVAQNVARLLGPMAAGLLLLAVGVPPSLVIVAAVAAVGAVLLVPTAAGSRLPRPTGDEIGGLLSGFRIASASPLARRALLLTLANSVLSLSHVAMLPIVAADSLGAGEGAYAAMMSAGGAGAMLGALFPLTRMRTFRPISILLVLSGVALAVLAFASTLPVAVAASGVLAALGVMTAISLNIHLQAGLEQHVRGRVMSLFTWAWGGFLPVGGLVLGFVAGGAGVTVALVGAAGLLGAVALANLTRSSER